MTETIEVCSLVEGAWFDVVVGECSFAWVFGKPHVRIKFMYGSNEHVARTPARCALGRLRTMSVSTSVCNISFRNVFGVL